MFSTGISLLTTTSMLIHSIVGCCWHSGHDHADDHTAACEVAVEAVDHADESCCGHDHVPSETHQVDNESHQSECGHHENGPCHSDECSEHSCIWMPAPVVSVDLLVAAAMAWTFDLGIVQDDASAMSLTSVAHSQSSRLPVPDVLHRCALSQTWLL